jgi:DNA (cytosine-5)-methyltransferase 1
MPVAAYYNENDPFAAGWLRQLISRGLIAQGDVDERSIADVQPGDLAEYTQCHFFAGIGGWSYALRLAGWPDDRPVWTGSCPCQPFSAAGQQKGFADARHLWPVWFRLIRECRPLTIFGEQVDKALQWLDLVSGDLEGEGYAVGSAIVGAHSVGAPHRRQRIYWVGNSDSTRLSQRIGERGFQQKTMGTQEGKTFVGGSDFDSVALPNGRDPGAEREQRSGEQRLLAEGGSAGSMVEPEGKQMGIPGRTWEPRIPMGDPDSTRPQGRSVGGDCADQLAAVEGSVAGRVGAAEHTERWAELEIDGNTHLRNGLGRPSDTPWSSCDWLWCRDSRYRPVEAGTFPLAHGIPNRVGALRGYGNAIIPQVAAEFIASYMEVKVVNQKSNEDEKFTL